MDNTKGLTRRFEQLGKIAINQKKCIGCGICTIIAPKIFKLGENGKAKVVSQDAESVKKINEAISACSDGAISYKRN